MAAMEEAELDWTTREELCEWVCAGDTDAVFFDRVVSVVTCAIGSKLLEWPCAGNQRVLKLHSAERGVQYTTETQQMQSLFWATLHGGKKHNEFLGSLFECVCKKETRDFQTFYARFIEKISFVVSCAMIESTRRLPAEVDMMNIACVILEMYAITPEKSGDCGYTQLPDIYAYTLSMACVSDPVMFVRCVDEIVPVAEVRYLIYGTILTSTIFSLFKTDVVENTNQIYQTRWLNPEFSPYGKNVVCMCDELVRIRQKIKPTSYSMAKMMEVFGIKICGLKANTLESITRILSYVPCNTDAPIATLHDVMYSVVFRCKLVDVSNLTCFFDGPRKLKMVIQAARHVLLKTEYSETTDVSLWNVILATSSILGIVEQWHTFMHIVVGHKTVEDALHKLVRFSQAAALWCDKRFTTGLVGKLARHGYVDKSVVLGGRLVNEWREPDDQTEEELHIDEVVRKCRKRIEA